MRITSYHLEQADDLNVLVRDKSVNYNINSLNNPLIIADMMNDIYNLCYKAEEHFYMIAVNTKNRVVGVFLLSKGTINSTNCTPREIFTRLCLSTAKRFVLVHNHPSGDVTPSNEDKQFTNIIMDCGRLMTFELMDHIIVSPFGYYSFKENNLV